jgi:4-amino-4-deoxy-L-arabinose transferase-like glycosyltransferase
VDEAAEKLRIGRGFPVSERWMVALLLAVMAVALVVGARTDGITVDEPVYISAGYRHLTARDYRLNPEAPPLAKMLAALPLLPLGLHTPGAPGEWGWIHRFFHENSASRIIGWARVPAIILSLFLAAIVWAWARAELGPQAALAALALTVFHPSLLAHGHLATTDVPSALTFVGTSWAFRRWLLAPTLGRAVVVALALAAAVLTRLTGWLLVPSLAIVATIELWRLPRGERRPFVRALGLLAVVAVVVVPVAIWAAYGGRYAPWPGRSVAEAGVPGLGLPGYAVERLGKAQALPETYAEALRYQLAHAVEGHRAYLLGRLSDTGWRAYYLVAFAVKNTPGFLLALALAAAIAVKARGRSGVAWHWLVPAVIVFLTVSVGRIDIGERYLLPVYPYAILFVAAALPRGRLSRRAAVLLGLVAALHVVPSLLVARRGYLTYFNFLAGGPEGGHRVLADSNLDWGQDLPRLQSWMRRQGVEEIQLGYHGSDDPERIGLRVEDLPGVHLYPGRPAARPFEGVVAVSPNLLLGIVEPKGPNPYPALRERRPDDRAGVFFIYRMP